MNRSEVEFDEVKIIDIICMIPDTHIIKYHKFKFLFIDN